MKIFEINIYKSSVKNYIINENVFIDSISKEDSNLIYME
jgi:hypothetical protein